MTITKIKKNGYLKLKEKLKDLKLPTGYYFRQMDYPNFEDVQIIKKGYPKKIVGRCYLQGNKVKVNVVEEYLSQLKECLSNSKLKLDITLTHQ